MKSLAEKLHLVSGEAENTHEGDYKAYFQPDEEVLAEDDYSNAYEEQVEVKSTPEETIPSG